MPSTRPDHARRNDRVLTLHPAGKRGVRIERTKYEAMRRAILACVPRTKAGIALADVPPCLRSSLDPSIFGPRTSIAWYLITVKQDLEARGLIEVVPGARPQHLRRASRKRAP